MKNLTDDINWYCKDREMVSEFFHEISISDLNTNNSFPKNFVSYNSCNKKVFRLLNLKKRGINKDNI